MISSPLLSVLVKHEKSANNTFVCVITVELFIPLSHSLKEKRKQVKALKDRFGGALMLRLPR
ncbi:MAG: DUF503 domain-containing protein [Gammaproteobacteria bacterium]|nr:DUF503 domain-containing protein [Gammaproteobacteria bacterium]